jgi:hypothetical protein
MVVDISVDITQGTLLFLESPEMATYTQTGDSFIRRSIKSMEELYKRAILKGRRHFDLSEPRNVRFGSNCGEQPCAAISAFERIAAVAANPHHTITPSTFDVTRYSLPRR